MVVSICNWLSAYGVSRCYIAVVFHTVAAIYSLYFLFKLSNCRNKNDLKSPIFKSFYNLSRYHLGSVALGSFIIALVQFIRVIFKYLEMYLRTHKGKCVECMLKCCQCCLYCFEKILKYVTRNAYIEIGM